MIVRPATHADIDAIVAMAQRFYATTCYAGLAPMAKESAAGLAILTMRDGVMLVAEDAGDLVGMVCLHVEPFLFNVSLTVAHELVWWLEPSARGGLTAMRMLKAAQAACRDKGVDVIRMALMADSPPQAAALYERAGFSHTEGYYSKELH